jgi:hypothetical protein
VGDVVVVVAGAGAAADDGADVVVEVVDRGAATDDGSPVFQPWDV